MKEKRTWLDWAREIQGLAQTGLTYGTSDWDTERYRRLIQIAAEMVGRHSGCDEELLTEDFLWQPGYATPKVDVRGAIGFTR